MKNYKKILFFLLFNFTTAFACQIEDLTSKEKSSSREKLFKNMNNPGIRLAWTEMKQHNKVFGLGSVNEIMATHEIKLCEQLKKNHPRIQINFKKSDFKGHYITCNPTPKCLSAIRDTLSNNLSTEFKDGTPFKLKMVASNNYQEGYIKARALGEYSNELIDSIPLHQFIDEEVRAAIKEATGIDGISNVPLEDIAFERKLSKNIDLYRAGSIKEVDTNFLRLIKALDVLLEVPFSNSNNVENELLTAANSNTGKAIGARTLSTAQSGDDLFVIIKHGDEIERVVGADARGLGNLNMRTRYQEYLNFVVRDRRSITAINDFIDTEKGIAMNAIRSADQQMDNSFKRFEEILQNELSKNQTLSLDEVLNNTQNKYFLASETNPTLMQLRAGAIDGCKKDITCIMNRVTTVHNNLKKMEAAGIDGNFGFSCLATEYQLLKFGL